MGESKPQRPRLCGAIWRRWDPHVHAPGTILNDQYTGKTPWDDFFAAIDKRTPVIEAVGITDYCSLASYEQVVAAKAAGKLPACSLIFPNVELRLGVGTLKQGFVNIHLLVDPGPDHVAETKRFLSRLTFEAHGDKFACTPDDLTRLGHKEGVDAADKRKALETGTLQFKVNFDQLREEYRRSAWAQENIRIAVAGATGDGTGGLRDGSEKALRTEVEKFADIIFASSRAQCDFWLGQKGASVEELRKNYGGLKPCLHGSDGHGEDKAGVPYGDRYCWIKGDATFDALRQACIDPANRVHIGPTPPLAAATARTIANVSLQNAPWANPTDMDLNPGLVAIIGPRGSGKSALAEIIAAGCDALPDVKGDKINKKAFLYRARDHLKDGRVTLTWGVGEPETHTLHYLPSSNAHRFAQARYLSQQFVEEMCASDGMTSGLLREIERIVFEAHGSDNDGAVDFQGLLETRATRHRAARAREEQSLAVLSERIGTEIEKKAMVASYRSQVAEKTKAIETNTAERDKLLPKGDQARADRLAELTQAAETMRARVRFATQREQQILTLQDEVSDFRTSVAPESLRDTKARNTAAGLKETQWDPFLTQFSGDVDKVLADHLKGTRDRATQLKGTAPAPASDNTKPLIAANAVLDQQPLALLEAERARVEKLVDLDKTTAAKYAALSQRIAVDRDLLEQLKTKLTDAEGASERAANLVAERSQSYVRVFDAILAEQQVLVDLYAPIRDRLAAGSATLQKLSFTVERVADVEEWATAGEQLIDLRVVGPFRGEGTLHKKAEPMLKAAWETGSSTDIAAAMTAFRDQYTEDLLRHAPVGRDQHAEYRTWSKNFAKWLYSTEHIMVHYSVEYDGVDIRNLSPGTRGIVLLLFYLALDDADDRPLIIDQPEENLDPKSIYDELVGLFIAAKAKRQVIMVTHNANLVVNTDADQIIVAQVGRHTGTGLPPMSYVTGGLDDASMRTIVCDILEGGAEAFRDRARRLRVRWGR